MSEIYLVAVWSDGGVSHEAMQLDGRFPSQPKEAGWLSAGNGEWVRAPSDANIGQYLERVAQRMLELDGLTLVRWRRLTAIEHARFDQDREYRGALEAVGGQIQHNMAKARELHRSHLRHLNGDAFMRMDRAWVDASASGDMQGAARVEAKRKARRDLVTDPRIDAATTLAELKQILPDLE